MSNPTSSGQETASAPPLLPPHAATKREIQYLDTIAAYDQWAEVYDTDGNFLQALDTLEIKILLPHFLSLIPNPDDDEEEKPSQPRKFIDLGCGTGRNTLALLKAAPKARIVGLEPSRKMLDVAKARVAQQQQQQQNVSGADETMFDVSFETYDILQAAAGTSPPPPPALAQGADGAISTLVLEHVPVDAFFRAAAALLKPRGVLLVTNMHSDMGGISQAGFVHPQTGIKIRPTSYAHTVAEVCAGARTAGFEVLGDIKEVEVDGEELARVLGPRAKKWIGVRVWFGGCFRKM
ncbi:hypothetical protein AJ80_04775 [Polytolypa hystricis UAMH7299]|uniref:Methyltransferase type 12 domain-containing protein n=1 Tax=Polytolypa hystricis (strain UAMH7299) TaxID=1447883 RepID=A0A2B7Y7X2_POLH7|nr:hypothetical protein AJ80_04775 [Polytolypa hystricis UAMH7299]